MAVFTQTQTFTNGTTADGGAVNTEIVNLGTSVNDITNAQINSSAAIATSKTTLNSALPRMALYADASLKTNQVIYRGFGTSTNSGTGTNTVTVTLPNSGFDDATYDVFVTYLGEKATTPATRIDVTSFKTLAIASVDATLPTSATQFKASFNSNGGGNFACIAFSWVAIGTKA